MLSIIEAASTKTEHLAEEALVYGAGDGFDSALLAGELLVVGEYLLLVADHLLLLHLDFLKYMLGVLTSAHGTADFTLDGLFMLDPYLEALSVEVIAAALLAMSQGHFLLHRFLAD